MGREIQVHMNEHKKQSVLQSSPGLTLWPEELEDMTRKKAADGEVPHLFPSLQHMEVPSMCSHYSAAPQGAHRTGSLQEERKCSDQHSLNPLNTLAQAVKHL